MNAPEDHTDPITRLIALNEGENASAVPEGCVSASEQDDGPERDWDAIEQEYRAGILSVRAIGREYGVDPSSIRYRANKHGWVRNLGDKVRARAQAELLIGGNGRDLSLDGTPDPHAREEDERDTIEQAAALQVSVVRQHRKDLKQLRDLYAKLTEKAEAFFAKQKGAKGKAISTLQDLQTAVQTIESLARTTSRTIPLERQAFNLDADRGPNSEATAIEQRIKRFQEAKRANRDNPQQVAQAVKDAKTRGENVTSLEDRVARHQDGEVPA